MPVFIDRQLGRRHKRFEKAYHQALKDIQTLARQQLGAAFDELPLEARTTLLTVLEAGKAPKDLFGGDGRAAFAMILDHTMQGFFGDPRHGGNKDYVAWKMLGIPPMPVRGRLHYEVKG